LGQRQTEDLKVPGSIPGLGNLLLPVYAWDDITHAAHSKVELAQQLPTQPENMGLQELLPALTWK
jgi:hypothetical protein